MYAKITDRNGDRKSSKWEGGRVKAGSGKKQSATGVVRKGCIVNSGFVFFVHFSPKLPLLVLT